MKLKNIGIITLIYALLTLALVLLLNQNLLNADTQRILNTTNTLELFKEKHPNTALPHNFQILSKTTTDSDTKKIADGAPYSRQLTTDRIEITSPIYTNAQLNGYLRISEERTSPVFINVMVIIFALLIYFAAAFITVNRARKAASFSQNTIAKIKNIERSPMTQSYLIGEDDDRITIALNQLGERIQQQILSQTDKKENLYEFIEWFQFPIFVYNGKGSIRRANASFKNDFADTNNLDIFSPYADFLTFLVDKILHPDIQEKLFHFEGLNAYYQVRIVPLPDLDNRFIVTMMDVTRYRQTLEAHNDFIANVSHEFKTPLTSITGFAELLENGVDSPEDAHNFAKIIHKESTRLMALVQDTLLLTRQNRRIEKKNVNLAQLINTILQNSSPQIREKNLTVNNQVTNISLKSNEQMLHSIFENLIENAIKYTPNSGKILVSLYHNDKKIIFDVADNGTGLTEIQKSRIFDRFYRVDESRSQVAGTGLGLAIVKKNVRELGGRIEVVSVLGKGTTFTVTL
ncbi:sensor histidine kinase [Lactococcus nasutitermitis]|uniref:histidine kinase n=1 Tax=Lactococcus nasutitermitis TaxID=1652957 RepID=A0ABV9JF48_9LACT|nr:sensor histidine kinase [Lactococcus nasutitermitis]